MSDDQVKIVDPHRPEDFRWNEGLAKHFKELVKESINEMDEEDSRYHDGFLDGETKQRGILGPQIDAANKLAKKSKQFIELAIQYLDMCEDEESDLMIQDAQALIDKIKKL